LNRLSGLHSKFGQTLKLTKFSLKFLTTQFGREATFSTCQMFFFSLLNIKVVDAFASGNAIDHTLALIKPGNDFAWGRIIDRILEARLKIVRVKSILLSSQLVEALSSGQSDDFSEEGRSLLTSDICLALEVVGPNAIQVWKEIMGPVDRDAAIAKDPDCLRALFARSSIDNLCHGSSSPDAAARELALVFGDEPSKLSQL
jgi:nucleoside-diphosphate kinase